MAGDFEETLLGIGWPLCSTVGFVAWTLRGLCVDLATDSDAQGNAAGALSAEDRGVGDRHACSGLVWP